MNLIFNNAKNFELKLIIIVIVFIEYDNNIL